MPIIENLDFLNLNSVRNYPIKDGNSCVSVGGAFTLPNDFIVDAQLAATYDPTRRFYVSKVSNLGDKAIIEVADQLDTPNSIVGTFTIDYASHQEYNEYYLNASTAYVGATGILVIGSLDGIRNSPVGVFLFTIDTAEFEARVVIPALKGINRLLFENVTGDPIALTGDVQILARSNLRFKKDPDNNRVILDAGDGLGLNSACADILPSIKTINHIPPDENGNFTLDFSDCANLIPIAAGTGLVLQDICCKPCMGCDDIAVLTTRVMQVESALIALREFYTNLEQLFDNYKITTNYQCNC